MNQWVIPRTPGLIRFVSGSPLRFVASRAAWLYSFGAVLFVLLAAVELGAKHRGQRIYLSDKQGHTYSLAPVYFGSDPRIVAETVEYFRTHPKHLEALNDPQAALALVTEPAS